MADDLQNSVSTNEVSMINEEDICIKHRKEQKELQGKIVALKKSSAKSDKKKKKEVLEEIARMEMEMDMRHSEELSELVKVNGLTQDTLNLVIDSNATVSADSIQPTQRLSKAQKRRDKKCVKSKERNQQIVAQEAENVFGARNVETQKIKQTLMERNMMIQEIPSDGNCLYCAIDFQWQLLHGSKIGLDKLRSLTSDYLRANAADFLPFIPGCDPDSLLTAEQYEDYCHLVASSPAWGGEVELRALSHVLRCPIEVVQAAGPTRVIGEEFAAGKTITLTYHRHMYGLGEHYNSVKPYVEEGDGITEEIES